MATMVLVSLAAALFAVGLVVVSAALVWRSVGALRQTLATVRVRVGPYRDELTAEQATLQLELDGLRRRWQGTRGR